VKGIRGNPGFAAGLIIALLLIAAQTAALVHAYAHDPGAPQAQTCKGCVTANQLASACADTQSQAAIQLFRSCLHSAQVFLGESTHTIVIRQRGPPTPI
jgi:hypothetical protein